VLFHIYVISRVLLRVPLFFFFLSSQKWTIAVMINSSAGPLRPSLLTDFHYQKLKPIWCLIFLMETSVLLNLACKENSRCRCIAPPISVPPCAIYNRQVTWRGATLAPGSDWLEIVPNLQLAFSVAWSSPRSFHPVPNQETPSVLPSSSTRRAASG